MNGNPQRCVLESVPRLNFGPQSDVFTSALAIALQFMGYEQIEYHSLLGWSGRGFSLCWSDQRLREDPDEMWYLRSDFDSATAAVAATGFAGQVRPHADCQHAVDSQRGPQADAAELRDTVLDGITTGRPVIVQLSLAADPWQPEWALVTGYDDNGATLLGWSCFQEEPFALPQWEPLTVAVVSLAGTARQIDARQIDTSQRDRQAVELGVEVSRTRREGPNTWGVSSYEAWAGAVEADDLCDLSDTALLGAMRYHSHYVGHLAAQRWYTGSFLREALALRHTARSSRPTRAMISPICSSSSPAMSSNVEMLMGAGITHPLSLVAWGSLTQTGGKKVDSNVCGRAWPFSRAEGIPHALPASYTNHPVSYNRNLLSVLLSCQASHGDWYEG